MPETDNLLYVIKIRVFFSTDIFKSLNILDDSDWVIMIEWG